MSRYLVIAGANITNGATIYGISQTGIFTTVAAGATSYTSRTVGVLGFTQLRVSVTSTNSGTLNIFAGAEATAGTLARIVSQATAATTMDDAASLQVAHAVVDLAGYTVVSIVFNSGTTVGAAFRLFAYARETN